MAAAISLFGRRFEPRLWPTLVAAAGLAVLLGLGFWQLDRGAWKAALIDRIADRFDAAPAPLPPAINDGEAWDFTPVEATGRLLHERTLHLLGRIHQGRPGVHLLTPLIREGEGTEAPIPVLVNRGWVPLDRIDPAHRPAESHAEGPVTLTGVLRLPPEPGWVAPPNDPLGNEWLRVDIPAMAEAAGLDIALPLILTMAPSEGTAGDELPVPVQVRIDVPNDHAQYALTWFGLAAALLAVYVMSQSRKPS